MSGKLRAAAESALAIMKRNADRIDFDKEIADLEVALAKPKQDPVAWRYQNGITETEYLVWKKGTGGRNWTPLYAEPLPCPTCQSLARTVMMDQTGKA